MSLCELLVTCGLNLFLCFALSYVSRADDRQAPLVTDCYPGPGIVQAVWLVEGQPGAVGFEHSLRANMLQSISKQQQAASATGGQRQQ